MSQPQSDASGQQPPGSQTSPRNIESSPSKHEKPTKAFSCLRCFERKVKCDKCHPCANCVKSNVECHFRIPSAPRRKKKKTGTEEVLLDRLKRAEDLLRSKGILIDSDSPAADTPSSTASKSASRSVGPFPQKALSEAVDGADTGSLHSKSPFPPGKLIVSEAGRSRFIDNNLWSSVSGEFEEQPTDAIDDDSDDSDDDETVADESADFLLGHTPSGSHGLAQLHPNPDMIFKLWTFFLENVDPMTKMIHQPSLEQQLIKAAGDLENISRGLEALMFAIYAAAIASISDSESEAAFGEPRKVLFARYRLAGRKALARAKFLGTSDITVLQAFVLYLLIGRESTDSRTMWTLAGVASRLAQSLGLHRDGTVLGVPPFETEIRRRIWWQITILDFRSAELTGSGRFGDFSLSDTQVPSNVNDSDIWRGMTTEDLNRAIKLRADKPTEMIGCLLRCEFGNFWKEKVHQKMSESEDRTFPVSMLPFVKASNASLDEREAAVTELEQRLEEKFLRYCDPSIPIQFLASIVGRVAIASMRLRAHHPRRYANEDEIPDTERKLLWKLAVKLLESDTICHSSRLLMRFTWHTNVYFQWQALVYLLGELKRHTTGPEVDDAWNKVQEIYESHPEFVTGFKKPLHVAVGSLCLKAWDARCNGREEARNRGEVLGVAPLEAPDYILTLRQQRSMPRRKESSRIGHEIPLRPQQPQATPSAQQSQAASVASGTDSAKNTASSTPAPYAAPTTRSPRSRPSWGRSNPRPGPTEVHGTLHMPINMEMDPGFKPATTASSTATNPTTLPELDMSMSWEANNLSMPGMSQFSYDPSAAFDPMNTSYSFFNNEATPEMSMEGLGWDAWDSLIQTEDGAYGASVVGAVWSGAGGGGVGGTGRV